MPTYRNLTEMLLAAAERGGDRTAIRYDDGAAWRELSWRNYWLAVESAASALLEDGVMPGECVPLLSENRLDWLVADHAILACGAVTLPIHASVSIAQLKHQLRDSGSDGNGQVYFVSGNQLPKLSSALQGCDTSFPFIISFDPPPDNPPYFVTSWQAELESGRRALDGSHRDILAEHLSETMPTDPATILYTSGTTGDPKGVVLTHGNLLSNAEATLASSVFSADDVLLSWLPYSHVYARTVDHYLTTMMGMTLCLARSPETVIEDLKTIQPTWFTAVPRFYEKVWNSVKTLDLEGRRDALYSIFGGNIRQLSSGGAPLPLDVCLGYHDAGIPLFEGYGLTESSPVIAFNGLHSYRLGSVGQPLPGVEVRIADDGEILTRGPHVMRGYWNNDEATAEAIDPDGWLHTGDLGSLDDDGFLAITGRKKELIVLSNGMNVVPNQVEALLLNDPLVEQAVVFGDRRPYCVALVVPHEERLAAVCAELGVEAVRSEDLLDCPAVVEQLLSRLEAVQADLATHECVRRVSLLARPLSIEDGDLTASFKLKRREIGETFAKALDDLYDE